MDMIGKKDRSASLRATRQAKMDAAFKGRKYEIVRPVDLPDGQLFKTPFGNKGHHGYVIREIDNPSNRMTVGETLLRQIAERYGAVVLPTKTRKNARKNVVGT